MRDFLPDDILDHILAFLVVKNLYVVATTAHSFHETVCHRAKVIDSGSSNENVVTDARLSFLVRKFPAASTLRIPRAEGLTIHAIAEALHKLPNLSSLSLYDVCWRSMRSSSPVLASATVNDGSNLHERSVRFIDSADCPFPRRNSLRKLCVRGTIFLGSNELKGLLASPELRDVELSGLRHLDDDNFRDLMETKSRLNAFSIERLVFSNCTGLQKVDLIAPGAREVELQYCVNLRELKQALPRLVTLNLDFCTKILDETIESIVANCPDLISLAVKGCSGLQKTNIVSSSLRRLDMRCVELLGDFLHLNLF